MATRGVQQVLTYFAWDTSANAYKTGDSANHTTSWVKDGTRSATTNSASEVDSTNCPGQYKVTITATETDCLEGVLCGKSSTSNIVLIPTHVAFDYVNHTAQTARDLGASVLVGDKTGFSLSATGLDAIAATATGVSAIADGLLNRDMSTGTDSGSPTVRTMRQALRFLRNKWSISGTTLTVTKEDDTTASWTSTVTATAGANPITGSDPA